MKPPQLMGIGPRRRTRRLLIDKRNLQARDAKREQHIDQRLLLRIGIHLKLYILILLKKREFLPGLLDQLL